jgi:hypothetical protein
MSSLLRCANIPHPDWLQPHKLPALCTPVSTSQPDAISRHRPPPTPAPARPLAPLAPPPQTSRPPPPSPRQPAPAHQEPAGGARGGLLVCAPGGPHQITRPENGSQGVRAKASDAPVGSRRGRKGAEVRARYGDRPTSQERASRGLRDVVGVRSSLQGVRRPLAGQRSGC